MKTMMFVIGMVMASQAFAGGVCHKMGALAAQIMEARQTGLPAGTLFEVVKKTTTEGGDLANVAKKLILAAYEVPRFGTREFQIQAVHDFQSKMFLACYRAKDDA